MENVMNIGKRRELFWDDTMLDLSRTHSTFKMHEPVKRECVITFDEDWAVGHGCNYNCIVQDDDCYRLYVNLGKFCYLESTDGVHWEKPSLGICERNGSTDNNILFPYHDTSREWPGDGFRVIIDPNPDCLPEERYKAVANQGNGLMYYTSPDGIHFTPRYEIKVDGHFDSVNTLIYDENIGRYRCYFRAFHPTPDPTNGSWVRDICTADSDDLVNWSKTRRIQYEIPCDWHMYTNGISKYYRAPHVYVGFPTRYIERTKQWIPNYDELKGADVRRKRLETKGDPRYSFAVTDTLFMTSRDGLTWTRYNDAFLRPGPESGRNWNYGDVYVPGGMIETKSPYPGCDNEISFYCGENRWLDIPSQMYRYSIRLDGFVSQHGAWHETLAYPTLVTKKFLYDGTELFINFATSGYGHVRILLRADDGRVVRSTELFGDSTNRRVTFENGTPADLAGVPVTMEMYLIDADIYSFHFE